MISIILPCRNSGKHIISAVQSIIHNTEYKDYKLIIVDSSDNGTKIVVDKLGEMYDKVEVYHTKREGITKAINFGIKKAGDSDVYLTQDDCIIPNLYGRDWLTILNRISKEMPNCGAVTTIRGGGLSGPTYIDGFHWTGTWSLYLPQETLIKIGLFDEKFSPGPGDDIDYSYRIRKAGLIIYEADFWIDHHRMTENFNDNIEPEKERNAKYFRRKHGL